MVARKLQACCKPVLSLFEASASPFLPGSRAGHVCRPTAQRGLVPKRPVLRYRPRRWQPRYKDSTVFPLRRYLPSLAPTRRRKLLADFLAGLLPGWHVRITSYLDIYTGARPSVSLRFDQLKLMPANSATPTSASLRSNRGTEPLTGQVGDILWASGKEALFLAFLVSILGSVAIGILGGICGQMTPSLPPGLDNNPALTSVPAHWWQASRNAIHRHSFAVLFLTLFMVKSALRLAHFSRQPGQRRAAALALRVTHRFSRHWFTLLIKNAFVAFVAVLVLQCVQNFSLTHLLWGAVSDLAHQALEAMGRLLGWSQPSPIERWFSWYGANQTKFAFWLFYSAALCDDLGLPNYKTLARRAWNGVCTALQTRLGSPKTLPRP